ncbi:TetR/AcrR family transcriptional regulator [Cellulomonas marina]|uniref:DNA-binding transcriptional regulator YbjK n=1 Tax=Cellulomonas marina TaxID=988821 RepID=A0A1I1ALR8_9CELL|nr:TetR family transcriptional regulator [Cellulomonas marina]GIG30459.1 TetR family transcriptional regulator [Cellulomonas marina]SFB38981.1 DNA-binding transcriptional regulator YbjK [Cellulomonas marina]
MAASDVAAADKVPIDLAHAPGAPATGTARTRRTDPDRRERILATTLDLVAEVGVAGVSHRKIAARADVPLGSMTYHFASMDELLHEAFTRLADAVAARFEARLGAARDHEEAVEAVVDLIHELSDGGPTSTRGNVLSYELYALAARDPRYRALTTAWMARSRRELERHFDPRITRRLDALIEGMSLHRALDEDPVDRTVTLAAVRAVVGEGDQR